MRRAAKALVLYTLIFSMQVVHAREYIYPVASVMRDDSNYVYLIHQISLKQLQLLQWDVKTKVISPVLASGITPAGIKILPDNTGYSFIDQGSLYIKLFSKRSPIKIDMQWPLYQIEMINWIDCATCYFTARSQDQFNIYQLSRLGQLDVLMQLSEADCLYPQKIESQLYYIERSLSKKNYSIKCTQYAIRDDIENKSNSSLLIHNNHDQPIAFLRMMSLTHGFYVSYPASIESQASCLCCTYYQLTYDSFKLTWSSQKLFDFSVPLDFILPDSQDRLHESLLPLLPRYTKKGIYYCDSAPAQNKKKGLRNWGGDWYDAEYVKIYFYDFSTQKTTLITQDNERDLLALLPIEENVFYGYSMAGSSKNKQLLPGMWYNEYGQVCYEVPCCFAWGNPSN